MRYSKGLRLTACSAFAAFALPTPYIFAQTTPAPTQSGNEPQTPAGREAGAAPAPPRPASRTGVLPTDNFAYSALRTLGRAGLIEGFPRGTDVVQGRVLTRIEAASLVARLIARLETLADLPAPQRPRLRADDLRLARRLVEEFGPELKTIGVDLELAARYVPRVAELTDTPLNPAQIEQAQRNIRQRAVDTERSGDEPAGTRQDELLNRLRQRVSGYFQFRFDDLVGGPDNLFRASGSGGSGQRPGTSGPSVGGPRSGFLIRRGRIKVSDRFTERDEFTFQIDLPSNSAPNLRDGFIRVYDFPAKNFTFRAGQYAFPYGFELVYSSRYRETPERALGFSDSTQAGLIFKQNVSSNGGVLTPGSVLPFFFDQDRDIGVELVYTPPARKGGFSPRFSFNVLQGEGRGGGGQRSLNNIYDIVLSAEATQSRNGNETSFGLSFYDGALPVRGGPPVAAGDGDDPAPVPFRSAKRTFGDVYARYRARNRQEFRAEYSTGLYEVTPDRSQFLDGNRFSAWYVTVRQPIVSGFEGYVKYDEFNPTNRTVGNVSESDYSRKTLSLGLLYNVTPATRFRVNYSQGLVPYDPSAALGSPARSRLGLLQIDVQQVF